eukprot:GHVT01038416.1.p1 GENE.GHVT01038416.1~~GHVT01038416.1.p1  ORF type:complete len:308 (+),score=4.92 GHVT01038416.1:187-1110(+)
MLSVNDCHKSPFALPSMAFLQQQWGWLPDKRPQRPASISHLEPKGDHHPINLARCQVAAAPRVQNRHELQEPNESLGNYEMPLMPEMGYFLCRCSNIGRRLKPAWSPPSDSQRSSAHLFKISWTGAAASYHLENYTTAFAALAACGAVGRTPITIPDAENSQSRSTPSLELSPSYCHVAGSPVAPWPIISYPMTSHSQWSETHHSFRCPVLYAWVIFGMLRFFTSRNTRLVSGLRFAIFLLVRATGYRPIRALPLDAVAMIQYAINSIIAEPSLALVYVKLRPPLAGRTSTLDLTFSRVGQIHLMFL